MQQLGFVADQLKPGRLRLVTPQHCTRASKVQPTNQSVQFSQSINQSINQSIDQHTSNQSINQSINQSMSHLIMSHMLNASSWVWMSWPPARWSSVGYQSEMCIRPYRVLSGTVISDPWTKPIALIPPSKWLYLPPRRGQLFPACRISPPLSMKYVISYSINLGHDIPRNKFDGRLADWRISLRRHDYRMKSPYPSRYSHWIWYN